MSGVLSELLDEGLAALERQRRRPFLDGVMAACALVAAADGAPTLGERARLDRILDTLEALRVFDPHEGVERFDAYSRELLHDPAAGREHALRAVHAAAVNAESAQLLLRVCRAVCGPGAEPGAAERAEIARLRESLALPLPPTA